MNRILKNLMIAAFLLLAGCSFIDGVDVTVRGEVAEAFKDQAEAFLRSKGFQSDGRQHGDGFVLNLEQHFDGRPRRGLYAVFYHQGDQFSFFIGKGNSHSFSEEERRIVSECVDFLVEHAEMFRSGFASSESSTEDVRAKFYAKIKKA